MQVVKGFCDLSEKASAGRFFDLAVCALLLDVLVQRDALDVVGDDANLFVGFDQVVHFDDVRVVNLLEGHDFSLHRLSLHRVVQLDLLVDLDRQLLLRELVVARVDCGVGALSDGLADLVVVEDVCTKCLVVVDACLRALSLRRSKRFSWFQALLVHADRDRAAVRLGRLALLGVWAVVSVEVDGLRPQLLLGGGPIVERRLLRPEA